MNDRTAQLHLNAHKESTQNAHAALSASIDAHAAGKHEEGKQKMKEHDSHMKDAQESATNAGKEAKKAGENRAKASAIIEKNHLEKGHRDFRGL
ncbi:hypothetical protein FRC19_007413 [Serendipita sp. 401]|nr:hypothetical protein FRC19_007413 [Serendipita sp. 401]KAG9052483.1 hypothetical protein FS842_009784 [Serendipita sp. 407]